MHHNRHITRTLHDEHLATISLLNRLEELVLSNRGNAPDPNDGETAKLLGELSASVEAEISGHFAFEEEKLFPLLDDFGDGSIGTLLTEEHQILLPVGQQLVAIAKEARAGGFTDESWQEFRRLVSEFIERMISHIQKEEMGLLPVLDDMIDDDQDAELASAYAMSR